MADYDSIRKNPNILQGKSDMFGGITVDFTAVDYKHDYEDDDFKNILEASLASYKTCGIRGVWLKIPINKSTWIPIAVKQGFQFHHCFPSYAMMTCWLPKDEPNKIPSFATTFVGVGGFVISDGKLLVVKEKYRKSDHWKLPGGMVDHKEDIRAAVKREVAEETGIETEIVSLISVRHIPDFRFECSDFYFVFLLKPLNTDINRDPTEIEDARWMDLDEYIASPIVNEANKFVAQAYKDQKLKIIPTEMFLFNRDFVLYSLETPQINKL
ncbi:nudix hydrolase 8 [Exaiptasia diaphana]|uniref:Nudix hydrolase domain-containing protein n=1 Tax=Exaiptasia diaphana TaxID=2652724 RepID=A0A913Y7C7_EXADI|nr:nudix hydrolase 8 [Exaiptasia diaphana]KXJ21861.1 Nudix hydrolase 8 [Exaiptasia diaphana]